jgi:chemotaxis protein methyltransferase CheR
MQRDTAAPDDGFARLKDLVIGRTGHFYYADKDSALWERLQRRIRASGSGNAQGYLARLENPETAEAEWAALEAEITIGETFFFRDSGQFDALRDTILPSLILRRAAERRLRIWSAGCSTGAEPYSIAILLRRLLGSAHGNWLISILGTDINEAALTAARQACFSAWALRGMDPAERAKDFTALEAHRTWQLRPEHRNTVRFERHNIMGLLGHDTPLGLTGFDLILCRNVLIYFHPDVVFHLVRALGERLAPNGWLLLGHAEPDPQFASFLQPITLPGTVAWRPLDGPAAVDEAAMPQAPPEAVAAPLNASPPPGFAAPPEWVAPLRPRAARPATSRTALPNPPAEARASKAADGIGDARAARDRARAEADRGELDAARATLRAALGSHPTEAGLHYLDGMVALGLGEPAEAEAALRRAIYLDKGFVTAHYQLGLLLLGRGAAEAGRRSIANAARLARGLPGEALLEEGDGMTAATLLSLSGRHLEPVVPRNRR